MANHLLGKTCSFGNELLDYQEAEQALKHNYTKTLEFTETYLLKWAVDAGIDTKEIIDLLGHYKAKN